MPSDLRRYRPSVVWRPARRAGRTERSRTMEAHRAAPITSGSVGDLEGLDVGSSGSASAAASELSPLLGGRRAAPRQSMLFPEPTGRWLRMGEWSGVPPALEV